MIKAMIELSRFLEEHNFSQDSKPKVTLTFNSHDELLQFSSAIILQSPRCTYTGYEDSASGLISGFSGRVCGILVEGKVEDRRKKDRRK